MKQFSNQQNKFISIGETCFLFRFQFRKFFVANIESNLFQGLISNSDIFSFCSSVLMKIVFFSFYFLGEFAGQEHRFFFYRFWINGTTRRVFFIWLDVSSLLLSLFINTCSFDSCFSTFFSYFRKMNHGFFLKNISNLFFFLFSLNLLPLDVCTETNPSIVLDFWSCKKTFIFFSFSSFAWANFS